MTTTLVYSCLQIANEIGQLIETFEDKFSTTDPEADLTEVRMTISSVRTCLSPFLSTSVHEAAFDLCVNGIKRSVEEIRKLMDGIDKIIKTDARAWVQRKIVLYKLDFKLKQKLDQFTALFPSDPQAPKYAQIIVDPEGRTFWKQAFGDKMLMVPWGTFFHALESNQQQTFSEDEDALKEYIDFTQDDMVSPYEWNIFLHWFGPMKGSCERMLKPLRDGLLCGFCPAIEADQLLKNRPTGTFLIRFSKTQVGSYAVTFVDSQTKIRHCLLYSIPPAGVTLKNPPQVYPSLSNFATSHAVRLKHPVGNEWSTPQKKKKKNGEEEGEKNNRNGEKGEGKSEKTEGPIQGDVVESETCTVCMDKPIETVFLECGHLACCKTCSAKLTLCPICRRTISRVVAIYRP